MENISERLGARVRRLRELAELTQEELAERSDMAGQYISSLERGQQNATIEVLARVAKGLDVELYSLFFFDSIEVQPTKQTIKKFIDNLSQKQMEKVMKILMVLDN